MLQTSSEACVDEPLHHHSPVQQRAATFVELERNQQPRNPVAGAGPWNVRRSASPAARSSGRRRG
jgi:hypothetical protein